MISTYTEKNIIKAGYGLPDHFNLVLNNLQVTCHTVLRHLPGKRLTCQADLNGRIVILKLFFASGLRHRWHAMRDKAGSLKLTESGLPSPDLIDSDLGWTRPYSYIIYDYIADAKNLTQIWDSRQADGRKSYLIDLVSLIARMHKAGIYQRDLHFDNFLIQGDQWYIVDGADISGSLTIKKRYANIGLLLSQIKRADKDLANMAIDKYLNLMGELPSNNFTRQVTNARLQHEYNFTKKLFRQSTAIEVKKSFLKRLVCMRQFSGVDVDALDSGMFDYLKQGNSSTLARVNLQKISCVVKRYNIKNICHAIKRSCQSTRAANAWRYSHYCHLIGIPTPKPILFYEHRFGILRSRAYFVYHYHVGQTLDTFCGENELEEIKWQPTIDAIISHLVILRDAMVCHGDLKASNFLVTESEIMLLDLDPMHQYYWHYLWAKQWRKDMTRFLQNFADYAKIHAYCVSRMNEQGLLL